jgi:serine/threonine-protein kinase
MTPPEPTPFVVGERYELQHVVGRGGYGVVFRGKDRQTGRVVAVKLLSAGSARDPQLVERMVREQQAMAALAGTNAVGALDLCRADSGALCLVMEWLEGVDLEQRLAGLQQQGSGMSIDELSKILEPVVDTLEKAREMGIVHRDLKPANIFLMAPPGGGVRLLDFGLSRMKTSATITALGTVMGSPSYIAPESWSGDSKQIDHRADLYSLGVIVFRALSGRLPFEAHSLAELLHVVTTAPRPSLCALRPDLPSGVDTWVGRALAISPDERFGSAEQWYRCLQAVLQGLPMPEVKVGPPPPAFPGADLEQVISAAWSRAADAVKRFAAQLRLPIDPLGRRPDARGQQVTRAAPPSTSRTGPVHPSLSDVPWPKAAARAPNAEAEKGGRGSLVSAMLAKSDLRTASSASGGEATESAAEPRTTSRTVINFGERLAATHAQADSEPPEPAPIRRTPSIAPGSAPPEEAEAIDHAWSVGDGAGAPAEAAEQEADDQEAAAKKPSKKRAAKKKPAKKKAAKKKAAKKKAAKKKSAKKKAKAETAGDPADE